MLSSPVKTTPSSALQTRQRLHRRQKSTPVAAEAAKKSAGDGPFASYQAIIAADATPSAEAPSLAQLQRQPKQQPSRQMGHRRGLSLDTRRQQLQQRQQRQQQIQQMQGRPLASAGTATAAARQGLSTTPTQQQHVMRETQQQCTVRPGHNAPAFTSQACEEAMLHAASHAEHHQQQQQQQDQQRQQQLQQQLLLQQQQDCSAASFDFPMGPTAAMMRKTLSSGGQPLSQQGFQLFASSSPANLESADAFLNFQAAAASPQGWASEDETSSTRRASRRVSNGIMDRVVKFEGMAMAGLQRPATPPYQNDNTYFPPTPTETPHERMPKHPGGARLNRFADDYDESMEETIKPLRSRGHHASRSSGVFDDLRQQAEALALATPARPSMVQMPMTPADFMNMSHISAEFSKIQHGPFLGFPVPADMQHLSPPQSQQPTPATSQGVFDSAMLGNAHVFNSKPDLWATEYDSPSAASPFGTAHAAASPSSYSETPGPSHRRALHARNESTASMASITSAASTASLASVASVASAASAASIADINVDEMRTETGVTLDDIATYIDGPSPVDGKWRCLYEKCDKRFGRKENIKSHVQTHLNDRQYQCPHCQKCFVRQHDLKRHAKIHTGIKPYPCECGNNFARHDALTRHRQRGMCIGAFDGAVRKIGKRGRPRKNRPSLDSRREKASRTRSKNQTSGAGGSHASSSPEASSYSGYSDSSAGNSPRTETSDNLFGDDAFDVALDDSLLDMGFGGSQASVPGAAPRDTMNPSALTVSSAPMPGAGLSTQEMALAAASPSAMSQYSHVSRASVPGCGSSATTTTPGAAQDGNKNENEGEDFLPVNRPASPAKSVASHFTHHSSTPPELSASSSPPQSSTRFFDLDPNSSCTDDDLIGLSAPLTGGCGPLGMDAGGLTSSALDDDLLLMKSFTSDDVLVQLDNSGLSMLNSSKFEDDYGMFNNDDVFFGSN